jgi:hypothetical protein
LDNEEEENVCDNTVVDSTNIPAGEQDDESSPEEEVEQSLEIMHRMCLLEKKQCLIHLM